MAIKIAVLGDLHYSHYATPELQDCCDRVFREWFRQIVALAPDFVIAVGDITQWGKPQEFTGLWGIIHEFRVPFIAVPGNHDCYTLEKPELAPFFLGKHHSVDPHELYCVFDEQEVRFILLDTAKPKLAQDYGGWLTESQGHWLEKQIDDFNQNSRLKKLLIFAHHPLKNTTSRTEELKLHIENSDFVVPILHTLKRTPGYYFCGHNHQHSLLTTEQWWYIQSAAPWDCLSFRWVTFSEDLPLTIETRHFDWHNESLKQDWQAASGAIPYFTAKSWEFANNLSNPEFISDPS
jgi:3',5'-cyclic AMP phosphodiesterase CpdA